jgi:butyrate kinase
LSKEQILDLKVSDTPLHDQLDERMNQIEAFLLNEDVTPDLIMSRSAPLQPMEGGTYIVNELMLAQIRSLRFADHASNLGPLMGARLAEKFKIPVYISDPITTDEFQDIARISGVPEIQRRSRSHALNIKASARRVCETMGLAFRESQWIVAHLGGGISIAAVQNGRITDVNDALLGMGPFSPERAGALPLEGLLDLVFSSDLSPAALKRKLSKESGLKAYLGTADLRLIEARIDQGDEHAELIFQAMIYQISKEMAAMASTLHFKLDGFIITGGMAQSPEVCQQLEKNFSTLAPVYIQPGENEGLALAEAGLRILSGDETPKHYSTDSQRSK